MLKYEAHEYMYIFVQDCSNRGSGEFIAAYTSTACEPKLTEGWKVL